MPSPYVVCGTITEIEATPGSDTLWAIKQCNNGGVYKLVSYEPGVGWTPYTLPAATNPTQINDLAMVPETDGWALDVANGPARWNGTAWTRVTDDAFQPGDHPSRISATGPNNVWISGTRQVGTDHQFMAWRWDGADWHEVALPSDAGTIRDIVALGASDVWLSSDATRFDAQGAFAQAIALHWDGADWTPMPVGGRWSVVGTNLVASSTSSLWMTAGDTDGSTTLMHFDGQAWGPVPTPNDLPGVPYPRLDVSPTGDLWTIQTIAESAWPQHFALAQTDGATWSWTDQPPQVCNFRKMVQLRDLEVVSDDSVYAVGTCTFRTFFYTLAFHYDGSTWTRI